MITIRQILKSDNLNISKVIRQVLIEIGVPKKGYLRIYNQDNTYAYPTFTKQEIPIKFI